MDIECMKVVIEVQLHAGPLPAKSEASRVLDLDPNEPSPRRIYLVHAGIEADPNNSVDFGGVYLSSLLVGLTVGPPPGEKEPGFWILKRIINGEHAPAIRKTDEGGWNMFLNGLYWLPLNSERKLRYWAQFSPRIERFYEDWKRRKA